jgi:hypothetical protein
MKAFPNPNNTQQEGMDLRDYIAIQAMQTMIPSLDNAWELSRRAYEIANIMLEVRAELIEEESIPVKQINV